MADVDTLATIKTQILARIEEVTAAPKPTYTIDGQFIDWNNYLNTLLNQLDKVNTQISLAQGPIEVHQTGVT